MKEGEISPKKLQRWMMSITRLHPKHGTIFRVKAILAVQGVPNKYIFHMVMDVSDQDASGPWGENEKKTCKIVFIGKGLDKPLLTKTFEDMFK